jgi:hypothetical protein
VLRVANSAPRDKAPRHPAHIQAPLPAPDAERAFRAILPCPLVAIGEALAALGVARGAAQQALNEAIKAGEVRLTHSGSGVLVVAAEGVA